MGLMNPSGLSMIWPLLAQVFLTFVVFVFMATRRVAAVNSREVKMRDVALSGDAFPTAARQAGNNFTNQFESPVLFYVLGLLAIHVGAVGYVMVGLAWAYVATRVVHAMIHLGGNDLRPRSMAFFAGMIVLMAMFVGILVQAL